MIKKRASFYDLDKKSVFITGGGSGIGAAITEAFLAQGSNVSFVQRSDASKFCDNMEKKYENRPYFIQCDIADISALNNAIDKSLLINGPISVLVNNAANDVRHSTLEVSEQFWDNSQALNLKAYFFSAQKVLFGMIEMKSGSIINMSSISYMMGNSGYPSYVTANSGINGMTRALAREFGVYKIRVNAIAPGWVMTDKQKEKWVTPDLLNDHVKRQCLKDLLVPDDIVDSVLFLASDSSKSITGQLLAVDAGVVTTG
jgi:NAD(P)-dependent dehydrogenase (short-subunit alcohol dehydrogenase family)